MKQSFIYTSYCKVRQRLSSPKGRGVPSTPFYHGGGCEFPCTARFNILDQYSDDPFLPSGLSINEYCVAVTLILGTGHYLSPGRGVKGFLWGEGESLDS